MFMNLEKEELNDIMVSVVKKTVSMYPNSMESMSEMKSMLKDHIASETEELGDLRRTIRNFFIANIGFLLIAGIWVGTIQTRQLRNVDDIEKVNKRQDEFSERIQRNDVTSAEIRTKLNAIEATLIEIRQSIRR